MASRFHVQCETKDSLGLRRTRISSHDDISTARLVAGVYSGHYGVPVTITETLVVDIIQPAAAVAS